jgi:perosamine synthetase
MILQMQPLYTSQDRESLINLINSDSWFTEHIWTQQFESSLSKFTEIENIVATNNGTISLSLIYYVLGIGVGDEIIMPNYTMFATVSSAKMLGITPVLCDVEEETLNIDIDLIPELITSKTKAIVLVNANGRYPSYPIESLIELCNNYGIFLIEDSAQSLGSYFPNGLHCGSAGVMSSFSFSTPKLITTGQGGSINSNNIDLIEKVRKIKNFGRSDSGLDIHDVVGWNFKFTEFQAALGISQLNQIDWRIKRKKEIYKLYSKNLFHLDMSLIFLIPNDTIFTVPWFIEVKTNRRDELKLFLSSKGIQTRIMYPPLNEQKAINVSGHFPVSENIGKTGLWLPSHVQLTDEEINYITDNIILFFNK